MTEIIHLLNQYGYIILFLSLMIELIIVPIPNEALMSYVGLLCFEGKLNLPLSIIFAGLGGITGATISYWIGYKLGVPFFRRYGHYIHLGPEKLDKMSKWYTKYGKVLLLVSFFIPGIRHIASIISGVIKLPYRSFSIFSYIGVVLWVGTFIALGDILGPKLDQYQEEIKKWLVVVSIVIGFFVLLFFVIRLNKEFIKQSFVLLYEAAFKRFRSFLKLKFIILIIFILFVSLISLMIGMIQDFVANEFGQFNVITRMIVFAVMNEKWYWLMKAVSYLSAWSAIGVVSVITIVLIFIYNKNKWLEIICFISTFIGSFLFSKGISWLFRFILNDRNISGDFPNEQTVLVMSVYGFFLFIFIRHQKNFVSSVIMTIAFFLLLAAYFLSGVYLHHSNPSDLVGGYVFSAVWLTGMFLALEMFRLLSTIKEHEKKAK